MLGSAASIIFSRETLRFLTATGMASPGEDTDERATHPMSFVPPSSEPGSSIPLTVRSTVIVISEAVGEGQEAGAEELDFTHARPGEEA